MRNLRPTAMAFLVFWIASCAHTPKASQSDIEASTLFQKAETAFKSHETERAAAQYRKIRAKFPGTRSARLSQYRLGSIAYQKKNYDQAAQYFTEMLKPSQDGTVEGIDEFKVDAAYNLAACDFQLKRFEKAYEELSQINLSLGPNVDVRKADMVYTLIERTARKLGDQAGLIASLAVHAQLTLTEQTIQKLNEELSTAITTAKEPNELVGLISGQPGSRLRPVKTVEDEVTRTRIRNQIRRLSGDPEIPIPKTVDNATLVAESPRVNRVGSGSVGVLLPLTGKLSAVGKKALDAIALSAGIFDANGNSKLKLFFADTQSNETEAGQALTRLVEEHNISIAIGPITWKEALVVSKKAQELGVINLSLAPREGVTGAGSYIFQNALTPKVQVDSLVDYCITEKGYRRFGIIAPNDSFGTDMAFQFWDAAEKRGGAIVAFETYSPEDTDYQAPIQKLVGLYDADKYRKLELTKIAEFQKEQKKQNPKQRDKRIRLQPIVDFDALFIPDGAKAASQIVPNLAYFDVLNLPLIGTAEWGTGQLFRRVGKAVVGSLFPVAIHPDTRNPAQYAFLNRYREALGVIPDLLSSQAYEAMTLVDAALANAPGGNASELAASLMNLKNFESPLGNLTFDTNRVAGRRLPIFTIDLTGTLIEVVRTSS